MTSYLRATKCNHLAAPWGRPHGLGYFGSGILHGLPDRVFLQMCIALCCAGMCVSQNFADYGQACPGELQVGQKIKLSVAASSGSFKSGIRNDETFYEHTSSDL
jgi:hypothetical protein